MPRWTMADAVAAQMRTGGPQTARRLQRASEAEAAPTRKRKYGNAKVNWQGASFDSKHELEVFKLFELQKIAGELRAVIRQVSLPLPGSRRRLRLDFLLIENDGRHRWVDAKGFATPLWETKRDVVEQAYGITIETC